jgi:hypothetical protein
VVVPPEIEPTDSGTNDVMTSEGSSIKLGCKAKGEIYLFICSTTINNSNVTILTYYLFIALLIQVIRHL